MRDQVIPNDNAAALRWLEYSAVSYRLATHLLGSAEAVEDVVQQSYMDVLLKPHSKLPPHNTADERAWFLSIVAHKAQDFVRREARLKKREATVANWQSNIQTDPQPDAILVGELRLALRQLDEKYRLALALCIQEGLTHREAALVLGVPERTVSEHIKVGLERLKKMLTGREKDLEPSVMISSLVCAAPVVPAAFTASIKVIVTKTVAKAALAGTVSAAATTTTATTTVATSSIPLGGLLVKISLGLAATVLLTVGVVNTRWSESAEKPAPITPPKPVAEDKASHTNSESAVATHKEKDSEGKEWTLTDWKEGTRPYKKNLIERENAYKDKWGEGWAGAPHKSQGGSFTMNPGAWKWEEFVVIPDSRKASPSVKGLMTRWGKSQANVFAPGGGAEVTVVWSVTNFGIYHVDVKTKQITFAGVLPNFEYETKPDKTLRVKLLYPIPEPCKDGLGDKARLQPTRSPYGNWLTTDQVTGRVYFEQKLTSGTLLRYVEELRPYTVGGKEMLLPAILDYKEMYKKVGAEPVMKDGKRVSAQVAVRTSPVKLGKGHLFNTRGWGQKVILSADGRLAYFGMKNGFEDIHAFEIDTGKDMGAVPAFAQNMPKGFISDAHEATSGNIDDMFYQCFHPGCGRGPGRLCSVSLKTGKITPLYDSLMAWPEFEAGQKDMGKAGEARKRFETVSKEVGTTGGPADAINLEFTTTCFQNQCPRTGSIIIGGWDCAGLWRYHDGFVTAIAETAQMHSADPRPEWKGQNVAGFGGLQSCPDVAPDGSIWLTDCEVSDQYFKGDKLRLEGTRIVKLWRTDWPKEQPVNGYANQFISPEKREEMMLEYCKKYIANYAELSKIY